MLKPDSGRITVLGHDSVREVAAFQRDLGYMPQRFGLYEDLTVSENLRLYADLHQLGAAERRARFTSLLAFTGLTQFADRVAGKLSGGMKQKLGLACALLAQPKLLLLDEPSAGVDPVSRRELWGIVRSMAGAGVAVVWTTAYLDEAERCDAILLLDRGRLLGAGTPADFTDRLKGRTFLLDVPAERKRAAQRRAQAHPDVLDALIQGTSVRIVLRDGAVAPDAAALAGVGEARLRPVRPRFEDAFVSRLQAETARPAPPALDGAPAPLAADGIAIEASDLTRDFGAFRAVDHVSFRWRPARSSACSARTAPASRPPFACSAAFSIPAAGEPGSPASISAPRAPPPASASATCRSASRSTAT